MVNDCQAYVKILDAIKGSTTEMPTAMYVCAEEIRSERVCPTLRRIGNLGLRLAVDVFLGHGVPKGKWLDQLHAEAKATCVTDPNARLEMKPWSIYPGKILEAIASKGAKKGLESIFSEENAIEGSVNVFGSGLLTPHLVSEVLRRLDAILQDLGADQACSACMMPCVPACLLAHLLGCQLACPLVFAQQLPPDAGVYVLHGLPRRGQ